MSFKSAETTQGSKNYELLKSIERVRPAAAAYSHIIDFQPARYNTVATI